MSYRTDITPYSPDYAHHYKIQLAYLEGFFNALGAEAHKEELRCIGHLKIGIIDLQNMNSRLIADRKKEEVK